jgi:hypothetical protein
LPPPAPTGDSRRKMLMALVAVLAVLFVALVALAIRSGK